MALSKDAPVPISRGEYFDHPVVAATKIFEGAMVTIDANGFAKNLVGTDTVLAGIAYRTADNAAGASGDVRVKVLRGRDVYFEASFSGAVLADVGDVLYASDENTFTKTSTSNKAVGKISQHLGGDKVLVRLDADI